MGNILIVAAHPDDEVLGMGATIVKLVEAGERVFCLFMTDGETSRAHSTQNDCSIRQEAAKKSALILGYSIYSFNSFPDNALDSVKLIELVKVVEKAIDEVKPKAVFTHSIADLNIDHRLTFEAVVTACRPQPNDHRVERLLSFEVPSATGWLPGSEFKPNYFECIKQSHFKKKQLALEAYGSEMRDFPHVRSYDAILARGQYWGSFVGSSLAEPFQTLREISQEDL